MTCQKILSGVLSLLNIIRLVDDFQYEQYVVSWSFPSRIVYIQITNITIQTLVPTGKDQETNIRSSFLEIRINYKIGVITCSVSLN